MNGYVSLNDLPVDHPLRMLPLKSINAQARNMLSKDWRDLRNWAVGGVTFNQLGAAWIGTTEFRARLWSAL